MKTKILLLLGALALLIMGFMGIQQKETHPGQKVFMDSKCSNCHTVQNQNITSKSENKKAPDLSSVGTIYQANFLEKFLKKQEKIEDKTHPQAFKGSDEQLEQLAEWLASLKAEPKGGMMDSTKHKMNEDDGTSKMPHEMDTLGTKKK